MRAIGTVVTGLALGAGVVSPAAALAMNYTRPPVGAGWRIDTQHSEVSFRIRHSVGRVRGQFTGLINRQQYGLTWNQPLENGAMLSDDVEIEIAIEAVRQ